VTGETIVEAEAFRGQAYIARYRGDCDEAIRLATLALDLAPGMHALRARCLNLIGLCYFMAAHNAERAIESWRAALEEAREAPDDRFARIVLHNLGLPYSMEGDFNEALRCLGQMIDNRSESPASASPKSGSPKSGSPKSGSPKNESVPFPQEAIAHLNIARLKTVQGQLDEAESHLKLALDRCQLFNLKAATAETLEAYGNLYRERGEYNRALDFYEEAARAYRDAGLALTDRELLDERAAAYLRMGEIAKAEREADEYFRARASGSASERSTALITRGRIEMAAGRAMEAESLLTEAEVIARSDRLRYNEARAAVSLARLLWDLGRKGEAFKQLRRAVELSIRYDYSYLLSVEAANAPLLFQAGINESIAADYLMQIVPVENAQATEAESARRPGGAQSMAAQSMASQSMAAPAVELIIERPSYDLAINMLGAVDVYRAPSEPLKEAWRLSKALHILCYIASRRNHRAPKDTLIEMFWSDADQEAVAKNFHPTISHLRKALNAGQVVKKDFILYREGAYHFNPQYQYQLDTEEFERLLAHAREAKRSDDGEGAAQLLAEAIKLYRGDFLEEFYYNWIDELQSYYRDLYLEALKELIAYTSERGHHESVIRYGQMFLGRDPYQEEIHCQVMEAHVASGNRAAAIEQFDSLRKLLRRELGVDPLPTTMARYESLIK
jgi:DNA-binding SARP family transcriptional activator